MSVQSPVLPGSGAGKERPSRDRSLETPTTARRSKRYMVIVENDEFHTYPYVIEVLRKVCGHDRNRAYRLTNQVHFHGQAVVWIGPLEHAELKTAQIRSYGPDLYARQDVSVPLGARVELFDRE